MLAKQMRCSFSCDDDEGCEKRDFAVSSNEFRDRYFPAAS
jgi:hypothetical protein